MDSSDPQIDPALTSLSPPAPPAAAPDQVPDDAASLLLGFASLSRTPTTSPSQSSPPILPGGAPAGPPSFSFFPPPSPAGAGGLGLLPSGASPRRPPPLTIPSHSPSAGTMRLPLSSPLYDSLPHVHARESSDRRGVDAEETPTETRSPSPAVAAPYFPRAGTTLLALPDLRDLTPSSNASSIVADDTPSPGRAPAQAQADKSKVPSKRKGVKVGGRGQNQWTVQEGWVPKAKRPKTSKAAAACPSTSAPSSSKPKASSSKPKSTKPAAASSKPRTPTTAALPERLASPADSAKPPESEVEAEGEQEHEDDEPNGKLYCVCHTPYDEDRTMIACDRCEEWYHVDCMGMNEDDVDLVDQFICPICETTTYDRTTYHVRCARPKCNQPSRTPLSLYCTDACGISLAASRLKSSKLPPDLVWRAVKDARPLDGVVISPETNTVLPSLEAEQRRIAQARADLARAVEEREAVEAELDIVGTRERFLEIALGRWKTLCAGAAVDVAAAAAAASSSRRSKKGGAVPGGEMPCGFDARLTMDDRAWIAYLQVGGGAGVLECGAEGEGEGREEVVRDERVCQILKKHCQRHGGWQKTIQFTLEVARGSLHARLDRLSDTERNLRLRLEDEEEALGSKRRRLGMGLPYTAPPDPPSEVNGDGVKVEPASNGTVPAAPPADYMPLPPAEDALPPPPPPPPTNDAPPLRPSSPASPADPAPAPALAEPPLEPPVKLEDASPAPAAATAAATAPVEPVVKEENT